MITYRLFIYRAVSGQMAGRVELGDGQPYFGVAGCEDEDGVIEAVHEQLGIHDAEIEIVHGRPGDMRD